MEHVPNSKHLKYGNKKKIFSPNTGIYAKLWTFEILVYITEDII